MMRLGTYAALSFLGATVAIYHAFSSKEQFYPAMVHLSTSKISLVLVMNMGLVIMCLLWQLVKTVFLGSLRESEVERLNEQSWREVMEILFAITTFRQDFSVGFLGMVAALLLIKALHWMAQKRAEYMETTPAVSLLSHVRIISFMAFLLLLDCIFVYSSVQPLIRTRQASVALFFSFEYLILATTTITTFIKYIFYVRDMLMEGQWEKKAVYTFYLELIRDLLHLSLYLFFFTVIFMSYQVPLHLIRELYETFRNFKVRISDYLRYREITSNMNMLFPDATQEELSASDATCIICREEMVSAKKLPCGHLFHAHCLRTWVERQNTCPTCRAPVIRDSWETRQPTPAMLALIPQNAGPGAAAETSSGETSSQIDAERITPTPQEIRQLVAASAAALYQKSISHRPAVRTVNHNPAPNKGIDGLDMSLEGAVSRVKEHQTSPLFPSAVSAEAIQHQIEALQRQLDQLKRQVGSTSLVSDAKGKDIADPSLGQTSHGPSGP